MKIRDHVLIENASPARPARFKDKNCDRSKYWKFWKKYTYYNIFEISEPQISEKKLTKKDDGEKVNK